MIPSGKDVLFRLENTVHLNLNRLEMFENIVYLKKRRSTHFQVYLASKAVSRRGLNKPIGLESCGYVESLVRALSQICLATMMMMMHTRMVLTTSLIMKTMFVVTVMLIDEVVSMMLMSMVTMMMMMTAIKVTKVVVYSWSFLVETVVSNLFSDIVAQRHDIHFVGSNTSTFAYYFDFALAYNTVNSVAYRMMTDDV